MIGSRGNMPWEEFSFYLRRSASAASGPGMVIVILDGAATLYFFTNGLHSLIFTNISKIVFAKTLITGEIIEGKKLEECRRMRENTNNHSQVLEYTWQRKMNLTYHLSYHFDVVEKIYFVFNHFSSNVCSALFTLDMPNWEKFQMST